MVDILKDRLIGFFDVLGFSNALQTQDVENLHLKYSKFIDEANYTVFSPASAVLENKPPSQNFAKSQFLFDSLVLVSKETDDPTAVCHYILACLALMKLSFLNGLFFVEASL